MRKITYRNPSESFRKMAEPTSGSRASLGMDNSVGEYYLIALENLIPFASQARKLFNEEEIQQLAESIKQYGIRQPLTVIPSTTEANKFEVVSGERRLRAAKIAGIEKAPCIIISDLKKAEEIALIENIHRSDLHPIELGNAYKQLIEKKLIKSPAELSRVLSVSKANISEYLKYANLDTDVQQYILTNGIRSLSLLRKIAKLGTDLDGIKKIVTRNFVGGKNSCVVKIDVSEGKILITKENFSALDFEVKQELKTLLLNIANSLDDSSQM